MRKLNVACCSLLVGLASGVAQAQERNAPSAAAYTQNKQAINEADSRAEKEAERLVSLPPERIILLLTQEPGLSLEIKKMLVRRAYAQGQILDPNELTDEAVFRLVRDDDEVRSMITQQIVDRGYVRAKPTKEEIQHELEQQQRLARQASEQEREEETEETTEAPTGSDRSTNQNPYSRPQRGNPSYTPGLPPDESMPNRPTPSIDQRRALLQASAGTDSEQNQSTGLPLDALNPQQISPEQLQQLISTYGQGQYGEQGRPDLSQLTNGMRTGSNSSESNPEPQSQEEAFNRTQNTLNTARPPIDVNYLNAPVRRMRSSLPAVKDRPALLRQANPYADVPSLYDLYSQIGRAHV